MVGLSGMVVDFSITWVLKEKVRIQKLIANGCGFVFAASTNYFLNSLWTFHSGNIPDSSRYISFLVVSVTGLGLNTLIVHYLNNKAGLNFYISKAGAIGIVVIWNFLMSAFYVFT